MIYMFLADGFEEIEALCPLDLLIRAGLSVKTVGIQGKEITGAHGIKIKADIADVEFNSEDLDAVILPGGMPGTANLENSEICMNALKFAYDNKKLVCAICAAPSILGHQGMLKGRNAVCFPGFEEDLMGANVKNSGVCKDGKIITAAGMGVAFEFGLAIVEDLASKDKANELYKTTQACRR